METKKTKLLSAVFAMALLAGCASTSTDDSGDTSSADSSSSAQAPATTSTTSSTDSMANLETVFYFDFDQATLSASTRAALDAQIAALKGSTKSIRLEGHADERGTREYNMALGERRAKAVANYLTVNGIEGYRIETVSYGEERPAMSGSGDSAWSKNRRVELK